MCYLAVSEKASLRCKLMRQTVNNINNTQGGEKSEARQESVRRFFIKAVNKINESSAETSQDTN